MCCLLCRQPGTHYNLHMIHYSIIIMKYNYYITYVVKLSKSRSAISPPLHLKITMSSTASIYLGAAPACEVNTGLKLWSLSETTQM